MAITHKIYSSRSNNNNSELYVGEAGRLFYAQNTGTGVAPTLRYSDGVTPGGLPLSGGSITVVSEFPPNNPTEGNLWYNPVDGRLYVYYDNTWVDASPDVQGAVESILAGDGISINTSTGVVTITATGTGGGGSFTVTNISYFTNDVGYLTSTDLTGYATETWVENKNYLTATDVISYVTATYVTEAIDAAGHPKNELSSGTWKIVLDNTGVLTVDPYASFQASSGALEFKVLSTSSSINLIGELHVHSPLAPTAEPIFRVLNDGQVRFLVPTSDKVSAAFMVIGSTSSHFVSPQNAGVMIHTTGNQDIPSRIYVDGANSYAASIGRRYNGNSFSPAALTTGTGNANIISRVGATPYNGDMANGGWPSVSTARIDFVITEDQTPTQQGNRIEFWTTPIGSNSIYNDIKISSLGITFRDNTSQDTAAIPLTQRGTAGGVATLGLDGKVPTAQLPAGATIYKGGYDALTNLTIDGYTLGPLMPPEAIAGWQYSVTNTGTQTLNTLTGAVSYYPGDYIIYNGNGWDRIAGQNIGVATFNGRSGDVVMTTTDVINVLTPASISIDKLASSSVNIVAGIGLTGGGNVNLGSSVTLNNGGVTSIHNGTGISISASTGTVTVTNAGVTSIVAGTGTFVSATTGVVTIWNNPSAGPQGVQGVQGAQGFQGTVGAQGVQGVQGAQGLTGPITTATSSVLGGIKLGTGVTATGDGTLNLAPHVTSLTAGTATVVTTSTGAVTLYSEIATSSTFGVIKIGTGLSIDGNGVVSTSQVQTIRNAGAVNTLTIDFNTDEIITIQPTAQLDITLQNYKIGKVVRVYIVLNSAQNVNLGVNGRINTNAGAVLIPSSAVKNAPQTMFVNYTCLSNLAQDCFAQVVQ